MDELLNNAWELFTHLDGEVDSSLIKAVKYFIHEHDFDMEQLPDDLYKAVASEMYQESIESSV